MQNNQQKLRKISYIRDTSTKSDGCYTFKQGQSCVIAGVHAPRDCPKYKQNPERSTIEVQVYERCEDEKNRRTELEEFIRSAVNWTVYTEKYPNAMINICTQIVKDDGSIESVATNATTYALLQSGVDMKGIVIGMCVIGIEKNNQIEIIVDPEDVENYKWKLFTIWDTKLKSIVAMKMNGKCNDNELQMSLKISMEFALKMVNGIKTVIEKQYSH